MAIPFTPLQKDAYKIGHVFQYKQGTEYVYSNFTPRSGKLSNVLGSKGIYFVGLQYFIKTYLMDDWNKTFFSQPKEKVIAQYKKSVNRCMGYDVPVEHMEALHDLGYLPLEIKALPEGSYVPYGVPVLTIINTDPRFAFITNMIESVLSNELWLPITSATTYMAFRKNSLMFSELTCDDNSFVPWQNHDFSMRGMQNRFAAALSGFALIAMGSFGTDTLPAVELAIDYYGADEDNELIAMSVAATEHSVMTAGNDGEEFETLEDLLTRVYPTGMLATVADSYDFWRYVTEYLARLKDVILARDGKLIIRPDSGDPIDIICGTGSNFEDIGEYYEHVDSPVNHPDYFEDYLLEEVQEDTPHGEHGPCEYEQTYKIDGRLYKATIHNISWNRHDKQYYFIDMWDKAKITVEEVEITPESKGLIQCLWDIFGGTINTKGYKVLNPKIGAIYGDSITLERQYKILEKLKDAGFASSNVVFGVGSFSLSYVTRDTHGMAFKTTWAKINGKGYTVFKDPKTDRDKNGKSIKKSARGLLMVTTSENGYALVEEVTPKQEKHGCLETVFKNSQLVKEYTLAEIRKTVDTHI